MHALRLDSGSHCRAAGSGPCYVLHDFHKVEAFEDTCQVCNLCMQVVPHSHRSWVSGLAPLDCDHLEW